MNVEYYGNMVPLEGLPAGAVAICPDYNGASQIVLRIQLDNGIGFALLRQSYDGSRFGVMGPNEVGETGIDVTASARIIPTARGMTQLVSNRRISSLDLPGRLLLTPNRSFIGFRLGRSDGGVAFDLASGRKAGESEWGEGMSTGCWRLEVPKPQSQDWVTLAEYEDDGKLGVRRP